MFNRSKQNLESIGLPVVDTREKSIDDAFHALAAMLTWFDSHGQKAYWTKIHQAYNAWASGNDLMTFEDDGSQTTRADCRKMKEMFKAMRENRE